MTFGSLFSGIGGLDLGLEWAGLVCRWQVEISEFCQSILNKQWPNLRKGFDVKQFPDTTWTREDLIVDLLCGGPPCQPVSVIGACSGARKGDNDPRWLWPEFRRIANTVQPKYLLIENVVGLLSSGLGDTIRRDIERDGWATDPWEKIGACCAGAPHIRNRVFLVAYPHVTPLERRRILADLAESSREAERQAPEWEWKRGTLRYRSSRVGQLAGRQGRWLSEPAIHRVVDGISSRLDTARNKALGNAVVPQVAELIGRQLCKLETTEPLEGSN